MDDEEFQEVLEGYWLNREADGMSIGHEKCGHWELIAHAHFDFYFLFKYIVNHPCNTEKTGSEDG